jgi:hypothetical protein
MIFPVQFVKSPARGTIDHVHHLGKNVPVDSAKYSGIG